MKWAEHFWRIARNWAIFVSIILYISLTLLCSFSHPMDIHLPDGSERELRDLHDGGRADRQEKAERAMEKERSGQELSDREQRDVFEHFMKDTV